MKDNTALLRSFFHQSPRLLRLLLGMFLLLSFFW
jgi:hypothetical protein